jgi:hypothetical protein
MAGGIYGPDGMSLSPGTPAADDMTKGIDLYDHEIIAIEEVVAAINRRTHDGAKSVDRDALQREIKQRFEEIGLVVSVRWYEFAIGDRPEAVEGALMPEIVFMGRTEAKPFDRDQQVHEVTNDLLGLGEGGVISTKGAEFADYMRNQEKHQH